MRGDPGGKEGERTAFPDNLIKVRPVSGTVLFLPVKSGGDSL